MVELREIILSQYEDQPRYIYVSKQRGKKKRKVIGYLRQEDEEARDQYSAYITRKDKSPKYIGTSSFLQALKYLEVEFTTWEGRSNADV